MSTEFTAGDDAEGPPARAGELGSLAKAGRLLAGVPAFGKLLYRLLGDDRVSLLDRVIFGAALVYLFVPMDLVPDWIPALGQLDDLVVVGITLDRLLHRTDEAVLAEHWDGDGASLEALRDLLDRAMSVLPGWARGLLRAG
ncbi:MAG: YkvA family protein [Gemmatimonadota bacterium]